MDETHPPLTLDALRDALRLWASGVALVTVHWKGRNHGMTVSSFSSVSLEPPFILVCLEKGTETQQMVAQSGVFAVCILAQDQQALSDRFAGRVPDEEDRFADLDFRFSAAGAPIPVGCLASLDCQVEHTYSAGTHDIVLGRISAAQRLRSSPPLIYFNRHYRRLEDLDPPKDS